MEREFANEQDALAYAIHNQRDRRNLTDADLMRLIAIIDERRKRGGDRKGGKSIAQCCAIEKSAAATARIVGTAERKVEKARTVIDHAPEPVKQAVLSGEKSINRAYHETQEHRASKKKYTLRHVETISPPVQKCI